MQNLWVTPPFLASSKNLAMHFSMNQRSQVSTLSNNVVDARLVVNEFLNQSFKTQEMIAMRVGYQNRQELTKELVN